MSIETFGRYQLLKKLAMGGMAQIYLARQLGPEGFEKLLVVKRILPHLAENREFVTMFLDEARIAARLNHPNVVQIFDLGAQDDSYFIAMEYIHGEDVRRVWKQAETKGEGIPVEIICRIVIDACSGLDYAHKKTDPQGRPLNIVHRDISPQNLLVSFDGAVKIVDFGIAKAADQSTVTRSGVLKGKYSYMSPEQAAGQPLDRRSDIFAIGVVTYELLTGTRLFKRSTDVQTLNAVAECRVAPPSKVNAHLPPALDAIIMKALARDRNQRYADARQFGAALEAWLLEEKLPASAAHLGEFMQGLYAERLAREQEEGRVLVEAADASLSEGQEPVEKATPSSAGSHQRPVPRVTTSLPRHPRRPPEPTKTGSEASVTVPQPAPQPAPEPAGEPPARSPSRQRAPRPPPLAEAPPRGTDRSFTTQRTPHRSTWPIAVGGAAISIAVGLVLAWLLLRPGPGELFVTATPPAVVTEAGEELCHTPCTLSSLSAGAHTLTFRAPGYESALVPVEVPATGRVELEPVRLERSRAPAPREPSVPTAPRVVQVDVDSDPKGAQVFVDDVERGVTPWRGELLGGRSVSLRVDLEGYASQSEQLALGAQGTVTRRFTLVEQAKTPPVVRHLKSPKERDREREPKEKDPSGPPEVGSVRFVVKPWANVECPPYKFGDTPFADKQLPAGQYTCTFTHPELGSKTLVVRVEPNTLVKVPLSFEP